ncbi:FkbM family methyltransferase [Saccharothrix violaceirubra]|uniref:FkbM family methyltransferase n=1 Tax=Saccharothrix violaceirubra TaxID=413306 RepID=A0A7W7TCH4_9PSEU|nr:FkbM family methyltransferase [Saccharothrix violaceirubra]MBB4969225.1 FkbM family methyltransferase [Saccharothrix violaceirubra]
MADRTGDRGVLACTVVARNYLPAARVLAASYLEHHPDDRFVIAVIDAPRGEGEPGDGRLRIVGPEATGIDPDDYLRMATSYNVTEFATAVKPYLLRELRREADVVMYLDPDIQVFAPMPELPVLARAHGIVLTPHFLKPLPRDGKDPSEAAIMGAGIFNLGFVATGPGSGDFLDFWAERLRHDAVVAPERQLFTDQRWVDQVPALFANHVLRDPGFNVAYWNVHERPVDEVDGTYTAGGQPLRFFHYSGYRPERPWLLSSHTPSKPRVVLSENPHVKALCDAYGRALREAGYAETLESIPYGFAKMPDGTPIGPAVRSLYREAWVKAERKGKPLPPHAFGPDRGAALRRWLAEKPEDAPTGTTLNRLTLAVWESRADLRSAFPQPHGRDAAPYRTWCSTSGVVEASLPEWALPAEPVEPTEPTAEFGVNVVGYLTAELGVGEMGRIVHDAITGAGVPVASVVEDRLVSNRTGLDRPETTGEPRFPISLLCVNADQTRAVLENRPHVAHHRYRIGLWAWELEEFPPSMHEAFALVDEVWTVSDFCREAIARHSSIPVRTIPVPVRDPGEPAPKADGPVTFLFAFDFHSIGERKNPWGVVEAFRSAFPDRDDVRLVLKAINGAKNPTVAERLRVLVMGDPRIELVERYLSVAELDDLYASSTAYVSLHRSEGFGLTVAEAMVRGLPVISTDYSSTTEFLDDKTGWPIPYRLVPVGKNNGPYPPDARWADPDLDAAAAAMREIADHPEEARRRGRAAREHILRTRSMAAASRWMHDRLKEAHDRRHAGRVQVEGVADPLVPLRDSRQALLWRPDAGAPSRLPGAPALRKAVLRAIDHYDVHQRKVMGALVDGVEGSLAEVVARLTAVEAGVDSVRASTDGVRARLAGVRDEVLDAVGDELADVRESVRDSVDAFERRIDQVHARLDADERKTIDMFADRDKRADGREEQLADLTTAMHAVEDAARLRHAPVPAGADVVLCDAGALLLPADDVVRPWLAYHRSWERDEADLMARLVGEGLFLDVGAHVGYHTLRLLQRGGTGAVAVEANPVNAEYLRRNVLANVGRPGAVAVVPLAAWDHDTTIRLAQAEAGNSGDYRASEGGDGVEVRAVRLDGLAELADRTVSLVKLDLQGRDHRALAGLTAVIDRDRPHVVCEFCPDAIRELGDDPSDVLLGYRKLGYTLVPLRPGGPVEGDHADPALVAEAEDTAGGFITLWLRPL